MLKRSVFISLLGFAFLIFGCDDSKPKTNFGTPKPMAKPQAAPAPAPIAQQEAEETNKLELSDADFLESETNRDPFRSYMSEFRQTKQKDFVEQRRILLKRYAIDELSLVAVVTGGVRARAMFRDPTGLGVTVKRGDYISKSNGRIKHIFPGRVVIEIKEQIEGGQRMADRVIELNEKKVQR